MQPPVVIDLSFSTPVIVNQPVTLTINIQSREEIVEPFLSIGVHTESAQQLQVISMTLPTLAIGGLRQVTQPLLVPGEEGRYRVDVFVTDHKRGANHGQSLRFAV